MNGYEYEATFSNGVAPPATSSAATLTVLSPETVLNAWDFNSTYPNVTSAANSPDPYINSPASVAAGVDGSVDVGARRVPVGMDLPYAYYDSATGTDANGAVAEADIVNSPASLNPNFNENTWRVRGGPASSPTSAGTPANGWSNFVPQYSQGVQFNAPTTGYNDVYVTLRLVLHDIGRAGCAGAVHRGWNDDRRHKRVEFQYALCHIGKSQPAARHQQHRHSLSSQQLPVRRRSNRHRFARSLRWDIPDCLCDFHHVLLLHADTGLPWTGTGSATCRPGPTCNNPVHGVLQ